MATNIPDLGSYTADKLMDLMHSAVSPVSNKIYSKSIPGAKVMFEPLWRLKRGFLSWKAVAELRSASGAAEDSLPARTKRRSPAQLQGKSRSVRAGTESCIP